MHAGPDLGQEIRQCAALTDGATLWAFRWASDGKPPTLYWREDAAGLIIVSEPIDDRRADWHAVPAGGCLMAAPGQRVRVGSLMAEAV